MSEGTDRFETLRELLVEARFFKLVCGAGNEDAAEVRRLALIYTLAGANGFDVSATPGVVAACKEGISRACELQDDIGSHIPIRPFITVSVGMPGDKHVRKAYIVEECIGCGKCIPVCPTMAISDVFEVLREKCIGCGNCEAVCPPKVAAVRYEHSDRNLKDLLPSCISAGAENIELHAAVPDDEKIMEEWTVVSEAQPDNYVSMCLDRFHLSNMRLVERIRAAFGISGERTMVQADGVPMSGGKDDFNTTLQAIAIADVINKNLVQKERNYKDLPILLSGGTNGMTGELAKLCNVPFSGVSVGTHARKIVGSWLRSSEVDEDLGELKDAVAVAGELVSRCLSA